MVNHLVCPNQGNAIPADRKALDPPRIPIRPEGPRISLYPQPPVLGHNRLAEYLVAYRLIT